jgi:hypothetical protein
MVPGEDSILAFKILKYNNKLKDHFMADPQNDPHLESL